MIYINKSSHIYIYQRRMMNRSIDLKFPQNMETNFYKKLCKGKIP